MGNTSRLMTITGNQQEVREASQPKTMYQFHNFCSKCILWFPKELGGRCPECNCKARTTGRPSV